MAFTRPSLSRSRRPLWALLIAVCAPLSAFGAQLLVNGVPIGKVDLSVKGLENFTFEKCNNVKVEANGDVKVDCPGYDLKPSAEAAAAAAAGTNEPPKTGPAPAPENLGKLAKRYWLVASQTQVGATQFDIDLYINKKWVRRFKNGDSTAVVEITKNLAPGDNQIIFAATKSSEPRKFTGADAVYKIIIGEGDIAGANLRLDKVVIQYEKTAADVDSATDEKVISAS
jgi:hypothetical protein